VKPHAIPADRSLWLDQAHEQGSSSEQTAPSTTVSPHASADPVHADQRDDTGRVEIFDSLEILASGTELSGMLPEIQVPERHELTPLDPLPIPPAVAELDARNDREAERAASPTADRESNPPPTRSVPRPRNSHETEAAETSSVAVVTPPPLPTAAAHLPPSAAERPRRTLPRPAARIPAPLPRYDSASVARTPSVQLRTQADIALALTAALTSRMKPPAIPRRDLRPSTAAWLLLTGIGVVLVLLALFSDLGYRWAALAVGVLQSCVGYLWIVRLTYLRDRSRGMLCAVPPLTLVYLLQFKYAKLRPLRFLATGAVVAALAAAAPLLAPYMHPLFRKGEAEAAEAPDPATRSKLEQLRRYREQRSYDPLCKQLDLLAKTDPLLSQDKEDRVELASELKGLCEHTDTGVKVAAMSAYARWDPDGARAVCLAAVRSQSSEVRKRALELLPHWRDHDAARAARSLIGRPGTVETNQAKAALEEIGGAPAERAAWELLNRADDQATKLTALSILEKVASASSVARLRDYATASDDEPVRNRAFATAEAVEARIRAAIPPP
jgi:hypothetical protein